MEIAFFLEGKAFVRYWKLGGTKSNVLTDFFINGRQFTHIEMARRLHYHAGHPFS